METLQYIPDEANLCLSRQKIADPTLEPTSLYVDSIEKLADNQSDPDLKHDLEKTIELSQIISQEDGKALIVGGFARDQVLNKIHNLEQNPKDIDIEVYGISIEKLEKILDSLGKIDRVGQSFGIFKMGNLDISIPRKDSKIDRGHRGFIVTGDPNMSIREAARRRDFTINSLALDPLTGEIIDEFGGVDDIKSQLLRATDLELFQDDPLRVLRAAQFAGRFGFDIDPQTVNICSQLNLEELSVERIGQEWEKLLLKSSKPSLGLSAMKTLGVIEKLHPQLQDLINSPQDPTWHPEGDVWNHTLIVVDKAAAISNERSLNNEDKTILIYAALCHDFGKPQTTCYLDQKIISHGHAEMGVKPAQEFLTQLKLPQKIIAKILPLIKEHLFPTLCQDCTDKAVKRLAHRIYPATIKNLVALAEADHRGRDLPFDGFPQGRKLLDRANQLALLESKPKPILMGRHLINHFNWRPNPKFGKILEQIYQLQLDNQINSLEEALLIIKNQELPSFI